MDVSELQKAVKGTLLEITPITKPISYILNGKSQMAWSQSLRGHPKAANEGHLKTGQR